MTDCEFRIRQDTHGEYATEEGPACHVYRLYQGLVSSLRPTVKNHIALVEKRPEDACRQSVDTTEVTGKIVAYH